MQKQSLVITGLVLILCLLVVGTAAAAPVTFTVNASDDTNDHSCDVAHCSLREALLAANGTGGSNLIEFAIPKTDPGYSAADGTWTISPATDLPVLTDDGTLIDGSSQATAIDDTNKYGPEIVVSGASLPGGSSCFVVTSGGNVIHHLVINQCPASGIEMRTKLATGNIVSGNYIGTDATGTIARTNGAHGVHIWNAAPGNTVGGDTEGERNLISGNTDDGVSIVGEGTDSNIVSGNYIGPDRLGGHLGNGGDGVQISAGASLNIVGGNTAGERNVISSNKTHGVWIGGGTTALNEVMGNYIGADPAGTAVLGNTHYGVYLTTDANKNTIGGDAAGEGNVILGNDDSGLCLDSAPSNVISGNLIGTNAAGDKALGNTGEGILILGGSQSNTIGGDTAAERNVISGNTGAGVWMQGTGTDGNTVLGNYIGTTPSGTSDLGNGGSGVHISHEAQSNTIGGNTAAKRNVISGNSGDGVRIESVKTSLNKVQGNYIGTNAAGTSALRNDQYGVRLMSGANANTIGGSTSGTRNIISGNYFGGVLIRNAGTDSNTVSGNYIGTDPAGSTEVSSSSVSGVQIDTGAQGNTIGGSADGMGNLISGNSIGVLITGAGTNDNVVAGNRIGLVASGNVALPNHSDGVQVAASAQGNTIGGTTAAERNVISGNEGDGILITGASTTGNTVLGNYVGLNWNGTGAVGNAFSGVYLLAPSNTIGGDTASERNIISGNGWFGVELETDAAHGNIIAANHIGTNLTGTVALANTQGGVGLYGGAYGNTIGGNTSGERNVISGNNQRGVWISGGYLNAVLGNFIGLKAAGDVALGNAGGGVLVEGGALDTSIGSLSSGEGNVISGNSGDGVLIRGASTHSISVVGNTIGLEASGNARVGNLGSGVVITESAELNLVQGNLISGNEANGVVLAGGAYDNEVSTNHIGLDATGSLGRHNVLDGVLIAGGATYNLVGGDEVHEINIISDNEANGVHITGVDTTMNTVSGNWIGIDNGGNDEGNSGAGVKIAGGAWNNTIGGTAAGEGNAISGNTDGVSIIGLGTHDNTVAGNYIGLSANGSALVGNDNYGVALGDDAQNNVIGGTTETARNVISGNGDGVIFWGSETTGNSILGNYIGTDPTGSLDWGNISSGVMMIGGHHNTIGGSAAGAGNLISGNQLGLFLSGSGVHHYTIAGNYVGTDATGTAAVPNQYGIYVLSGAHDNAIGGGTPADGNLISGNSIDGIQILGSSTLSNTVSANYVGTDAAGTLALSNGRHGVTIASGAKRNVVGGDTAGERNLISGNGETGVYLDGTGTMSNTVSGNLIGTDVGGTLPLGNSGHGVGIYSGAQYNVVGGVTATQRNVIADNGWSGVAIVAGGTTHNLVLGNYIGTDSTGSAGLGNDFYGVHLNAGPQYNTIGGSTAVERNVISGNVQGVCLEGTGTMSNTVSGNYIGTDLSGSADLGNTEDGVLILAGAQLNTIGGDASGEGNLISGNNDDGVRIAGSGTMSNTISGNLIGTDASGTLPLGNGEYGVSIKQGAQHNAIGGDTEFERNVIADSGWSGVVISGVGANQNQVLGNHIGTDITGGSGLGNGQDGVLVNSGAEQNLIGGDAPGEGNVISANDDDGVQVSGTATAGNVISGNYVGLAADGDLILGNASNGVYLWDTGGGNTVGGNTAAERNVISGNYMGVKISEGGQSTVSGNYVGTDAGGTLPRPNQWHGIFVILGAQGNTIGGTTAGERNVISGNTRHGVRLESGGTDGNVISGNYVGTTAGGATALANGMSGVSIADGARLTLVGGYTPGARNLISGNSGNGVSISGSSTMSNTVAGNWIGLDTTGAGALANGKDGVGISSFADVNLIGGETAGAGNVISGNAGHGVSVICSGAADNVIAGNWIGLDAAGTSPLPNGQSGVYLGYSDACDPGAEQTTVGPDNVIAGNTGDGILIDWGAFNVIVGNTIGTDEVGSTGLGNGGNGISLVNGAHDNTIGGDATELGNTVSGNGQHGVSIAGSNSRWNLVLGNIIGLNPGGTTALGNTDNGVVIGTSGRDNTIGGASPGEGNVISGNGANGLELNGFASANVVAGNLIGTDASGALARANGENGLALMGGAYLNTIGGTTAGERNIFSGNLLNGVSIEGTFTMSNTVSGNYIGLGAGGSALLGNGTDGVAIGSGAHNNTVGGGSEAARNIISGNGQHGISIQGDFSDGNTVSANYIGTEPGGTSVRANSGHGVLIGTGAEDNVIGGSSEAEGNLISGNGGNGVLIEGSGTQGNVISANRIGVDATGGTALPNDEHGLVLWDGASYNTVGGDAAGEGNLISGNLMSGVRLRDSGTQYNTVSGNKIGTDLTGGSAVPNGWSGVELAHGPMFNTVGGATEGERNLISGNMSAGVILFGDGAYNAVRGNYIGTDVDGLSPLPNQGSGVSVIGTTGNNAIGGTAAGARNLISGNAEDGLYISGAFTLVEGNYIGLDASGEVALPNQRNGVNLEAPASANVIGQDNVISGNNWDGVRIEGATTASNSLYGNLIGLSASGTITVPNGINGVRIGGGAHGNQVGGDSEMARNVISGNGWSGIKITGSGSNDNLVLGNYIGTDPGGTLDMGNTDEGVLIEDGAQGNTVGGDSRYGEGNLISGNGRDGVAMRGGDTTHNTVSGNTIGLDVSGTLPLANDYDGVYLYSSAHDNTVGGSSEGAGNLISGNGGDGVALGGDVAQNTVSGNTIGLDSTGSVGLGNLGYGVRIFARAHDNTIGGTTAWERNVIAAHVEAGVYIEHNESVSNTVSGNYIGTDVTGSISIPNGTGVALYQSSNNVVGGTSSGAGNLISGNTGHGVRISGSTAQGNVIAGNWIGNDAGGASALANGGHGILVETGSQGSTIGPDNQIAFNTGNGVEVAESSTLHHTITENSIYSNGGLGIENTLGGNTELAPPTITSATTAVVEGTAPPNSRVELFTGPDDEGRTYLAFTTAGGSGNWSIALAFISEGYATATATDASGNTSEFSAPVEVEGPSYYYTFLPIVVRNH